MTTWFTPQLLILGVAIGANNLATSLALGALGQQSRRWRVVATFGTFEFLIPLVGIWIGQQVSTVLAERVAWLGPALLGALGAWTITTALRTHRGGEHLARRATSWTGLVVLALGLSLDNLLVGFSLGLRQEPPLQLAATISVFAMIFTWVGMHVGGAARRHWERRAEIGAGVVLLVLAIALIAGWI